MDTKEGKREGVEGWMHGFKHENLLGETKAYTSMKVSGDVTGSTKIKSPIEYVRILKPNRQIDLEPLYADGTLKPVFNEDGTYTKAGKRILART